MHTFNAQAIVFAAGRSSRFNTATTKLSFTLCGQEMILYSINALAQCTLPITIVVGYQKEVVQTIVNKQHSAVNFIEQTEQFGTGHALLCSMPVWHAEHLLVINGDMPLITSQLIQEFLQHHINTKAAISIVTAHYDIPGHNYGRIIRDNNKISIVEAQHYKDTPLHDGRINAGIYAIRRDIAEHYLPRIKPQESGQIFLTDLIELVNNDNHHIETFAAPYDTIRGVNTLQELWEVEHIKRSELIRSWMHMGVRFMMPHTVHLDHNVTIGPNSVIDAGVYITANTTLGSNCTIGAYSQISNSTLHDNVTILSHSVIDKATIHSNAHIGPFAHIRNQVTLHHHATIGNFVEVTKSTIGAYSKAKHLSYLGNATLGEQVNIGAGTITVNYNGFIKQDTIIEDHVSIGSNNSLVAPITIKKDAMTAAGSCITNDVPENALAIARSKQVNKEHYAALLRKKYSEAVQATSFKAAIKTESH